MKEDKSIHPKDLPRPQQDADTKQAEEFIDKNAERKDQGDVPEKDLQRRRDDAPRGRNQ